MSLADILTLVIIMVALAALPSTSVALVITRSATHGFRNGVMTSAGIVLGDLIFITLAVLGLTTISHIAGTFFFIIKYLAGCYLIWFGITLLRNSSKKTSPLTSTYQTIFNQSAIIQSSVNKPSASQLLISFVSGLIITLGDIKAIFFYASLLPAFIPLTQMSSFDFITLWLITVLSVGGVKIIYAFLASHPKLHNYFEKLTLTNNRNHKKNILQKISGLFMIGTGSYLLFKQ